MKKALKNAVSCHFICKFVPLIIRRLDQQQPK